MADSDEWILFKVTPLEKAQLLEQRKLIASGVRAIQVHFDNNPGVRVVNPRKPLALEPEPDLKSDQSNSP